ncbi:alginate lyase family protein [Dysgonomonas sp. 511]|uniref:alginate lyase family protein n=1 Tax=Dysgonomonas sp. 511 TaxID=2302930 RepID=UPI0013D7140D|nr:alginate lyase family protein [Dysgonomonas sp. 511]NDV77572.1 twin-arginine translocation pathway signal protein [Dysgonomonas sp. 511]
MRKLYYIIAFVFLMSCGSGVDLPGIDAETDLDKIPLPEDERDLVQIESKPATTPMIHVGGLHTDEDFERVRTNLENTPWKEGWELLKNSKYAQLNFETYPTEIIVRGGGTGENYMNAARGAAAAYQLGLRWKIENDPQYAEKAIEILNAWARICKGLGGDTNISLGAGIYGYEFAVAGELLRDYDGWYDEDFSAYQKWMLDVFYPANKDFLVRHHNTNHLHYWANWGLCNIASTMAIGILADRRDIYNEAIEHFQKGDTNGRLSRAIYYVYTGEYANFAQLQESGRDQGHTLMCVGMIGTICQLAWNQGDDFYSYKDNMFLKACEYAACYNYTTDHVPYMTYIWQKQNAWGGISPEEQTVLGEGGRGNLRPIWALPYYHYSKVKGVADADKFKYTEIGNSRCFPEGGGGNYGENSGGFDSLGFGTLMFAQ